MEYSTRDFYFVVTGILEEAERVKSITIARSALEAIKEAFAKTNPDLEKKQYETI